MDIKLVQQPIAYKYLVYSPTHGSRKDSDLFEYIHSHPPPPHGVNLNRCLIVPRHYKGNFMWWCNCIRGE